MINFSRILEAFNRLCFFKANDHYDDDYDDDDDDALDPDMLLALV